MPRPCLRPLLSNAAVAVLSGAAALAATVHFDEAWVGLVLAISAVLAISLLFVRRPVSPGVQQRVLTAIAVAALTHAAALDLWRLGTTPWVRVWNLYHYYLGAEYFDELGYYDLYDATLAADRQGADYWRGIDKVRDLRTYRIEPRAAGARGYEPSRHFAPERWDEFRQDVAALQPQMAPSRWWGVFRDHGYNATPFWTALASRLTRCLPATRIGALKALAVLDLVLLAITFWLLRLSFGTRTATLAATLFALSPVNDARLVGGFLQYDWFCALALGLVLSRRNRPVGAAAALAYASLARIFPLALVGSAFLAALARGRRHGGIERRAVVLAAAYAAFVLVGVGIGSTTGKGFTAWREFATHILHHTEEHTFGGQRVGLKHVFTRDVTSLDFYESKSERRRNLARQEKGYVLAAALMMVLYAAAVARRDERDALLLGLVPVFALTVASRYYWACLALLPMLSAETPAAERRRLLLVAAQAALFASAYLHLLFRPEPYAAYSVFNLLLTAYLLLLLGLFLAEDITALRRASPTAIGKPCP